MYNLIYFTEFFLDKQSPHPASNYEKIFTLTVKDHSLRERLLSYTLIILHKSNFSDSCVRDVSM